MSGKIAVIYERNLSDGNDGMSVILNRAIYSEFRSTCVSGIWCQRIVGLDLRWFWVG
jgi:hypothetical protein